MADVPRLDRPYGARVLLGDGDVRGWDGADPAARSVFNILKRAYFVPHGEAGLYCNGREQGFRITRGGARPTTVWFSENRNSDHVVVYVLPRTASDAISMARIAEGDTVYEQRTMFDHDKRAEAARFIAAKLGAIPASKVWPEDLLDAPAPVLHRSVSAALRAGSRI
ncbi:hypothetical protein [Miltoncostaea oceani]|uniref:hypothetical protein n=1 Tax=Miltoncostaea oceani TaxID=2843216 RepID=UPI001C3D50A7|nr:hypothetical protein [Miltoncostaea oceani]